MRFTNFIPLVLALSVSSAAFAQAEWVEFRDRADHFMVNFPGAPKKADLQYKTAKGATLPAHTYTAQDRRGQYMLTVVDYSKASVADFASAIQDAAAAIRAKGKPTYDAFEHVDKNYSRRITVETADAKRWTAEVVMSDAKRLYITEAATPANAPPPSAFSVSLELLDDNGKVIEGVGQAEVGQFAVGEQAPASENFYNDPDAVEAAVKGTWKTAAGTCQAAFLKSGAPIKNAKGVHTGLPVTLTNGATKVDGTLVLAGARRSQIVKPMTEDVLFLVSVEGKKLRVSPVGQSVLGWPDANLDLCPGSRT